MSAQRTQGTALDRLSPGHGPKSGIFEPIRPWLPLFRAEAQIPFPPNAWYTGVIRDTEIKQLGIGMGHTTRLQDWLAVARRGSADVRNKLIEHTCERLRALTHKMLMAYPKVRRWSETDDVLQNAMLRLHRSLAEVTPKSPAEFYGLAAVQIRRELLDLARHYYGAEGQGAHHHTDGGRAADVKPAEPCEPETLERWTEFHEQVDRLPEEQQVVVGLLWYEGLSQPDAAAVLEISLATLKRRWQAARLTLFEALKESWCEE